MADEGGLSGSRPASDPLDVPEMVTRIAVGWLENPNHEISVDKLPELLLPIHEGLLAVQAQGAAMNAASGTGKNFKRAVSVKASLASKDHILSMIDGKPYKALRRHVEAYGLTPDEYRARYRLAPNYPMVAENHSAARRELAERIGLAGLRKKQPAPEE
jgi:predicted transcriptional regulator